MKNGLLKGRERGIGAQVFKHDNAWFELFNPLFVRFGSI